MNKTKKNIRKAIQKFLLIFITIQYNVYFPFADMFSSSFHTYMLKTYILFMYFLRHLTINIWQSVVALNDLAVQLFEEHRKFPKEYIVFSVFVVIGLCYISFYFHSPCVSFRNTFVIVFHVTARTWQQGL